MSQPEVAREALYQAADAEMVLLVPKTMSRAPEWLLEWIEIWAMTRRFSDAILAAWCEHHDSPGATESIRTLRELANRQGLGFLCADDLPQQAA
jgi:hypothetical protein